MFGKGELDKNAVNCGVIVEFGDLEEKFRFRDRFRILDKVADNVGLEKWDCNQYMAVKIQGNKHTSSAAFSFMRTYVPGVSVRGGFRKLTHGRHTRIRPVTDW
jgi:hypothetical protein